MYFAFFELQDETICRTRNSDTQFFKGVVVCENDDDGALSVMQQTGRWVEWTLGNYFLPSFLSLTKNLDSDPVLKIVFREGTNKRKLFLVWIHNAQITRFIGDHA